MSATQAVEIRMEDKTPRNKKEKRFDFIRKALACLLTAFLIFSMMPSQALAASITSVGSQVSVSYGASYGDDTSRQYKMDGLYAYCLWHLKTGPSSGASYTLIQASTASTNLIKTLYWGENGPDDYGWNIVHTSCCASQAYYDYGYTRATAARCSSTLGADRLATVKKWSANSIPDNFQVALYKHNPDNGTYQDMAVWHWGSEVRYYPNGGTVISGVSNATWNGSYYIWDSGKLANYVWYTDSSYDPYNTNTLFNPPRGYTHSAASSQWRYNSSSGTVISASSSSALISYAKSNAQKTSSPSINLYANWSPVTYTIKYNSNGGSGSMSNTTFDVTDSVSLRSNSFSRSGYTFKGWATSSTRANNGYVDYTNGESVTNSLADSLIDSSPNAAASTTLYAVWEQDVTYETIYYYPNGASGSTQSYSAVTGSYHTVKSNLFTTPTGYTFAGWNTNSSGTGTDYDPGDSIYMGSTKYLYAQWDPIPYTVTLNKGTGISAVSGAGTYYYGDTVTIDATVESGYTWDNWTGTKASSTKNYSFTMPASNVTNTANATRSAYILDVNGLLDGASSENIDGYGTFDIAVYDSNGTLIDSGDDVTDFDKLFDSGSTYEISDVKSETGITYGGVSSGSLTGTISADTTVELKFDAHKYTITYHENFLPGNVTSDNTVDQEFTYGKSGTISSQAWTHADYTQSNYWTTNADGTGTKYTHGQSVSNLTATDGAVIDLYAQWTLNEAAYTINHYYMGADGAYPSTPSETSSGSELIGTVISASDFVKSPDGYETPIIKDKNGTEVTSVKVIGDDSASLNFYYPRIKYTVTLSEGTGISSVSGAGSYYWGATVNIDAEVSTGYSWVNWTGDEASNTKAHSFTMPKSDVANTANAAPITFTIKYHENFSSKNGTSDNVITETWTYDQEGTIGSHTWDHTGYLQSDFWTTNEDGTGTQYDANDTVKNLADTEGTVIDIYAQWSPITYTIKYDANGGEGTMENSVFTYDTPGSLRDNTFTFDRCEFIGWNTEKDGSGTSYDDGATVDNWSSTDGEVITLYAQWKSNIYYTITYDSNPEYIGKTDADVTGETPDSEHMFGEWKNLTKNGYEIEGYKFVGWNTKPDGTGTKEDIQVDVTVTFLVETDANGNVETLSSKQYEVGDTIVVPADPDHWSVDVATKMDSDNFTYTLEKWENITDTDGADIDSTTGAVTATKNVTYLAKFQKDTVSWFIKGDASTVKASTGVAANDAWVQARYNEAVANSNVPNGQLILYPTNAGLQTAKNIELIGTLDNQSSATSSPWYSKAANIKSVFVRNGVRANENAQGLFADLGTATVMDVSNLNTSLTTDFTSMFDNCYLVADIVGIEDLDVSNATTLELMFSECEKLSGLNLTKWDTSQVENFRATFSGCHSLEFNNSIANLNTASAKNMSMMFQYCLQFENIAFGERFVTDNVTDMSGMFNYCENLVEIDMTGFNTKKVNNFNKVAANNTTPMFDSCPMLKIVHVGENFGFEGDGSTTVTGGLDGYLPNPQDSHYDFATNSSGYWFADSDGAAYMYDAIPNYVDGGETYRIYKSYAALYKNDANATDLTLVFGTTAADTAPATYNGAERYLTTWNIENVAYANADEVGWKDYRGNVTSVVVKDEISPKNMGYWFYSFANCTSYDLAKLDTSECSAFNHMFYANGSLETLDVSMFDTSAGTLFNGMFYNCAKIAELDLSSFDNSKAMTINNMFAGMDKLAKVSFGENWKWIGTGGYLPDQTGKVTGADGKWYEADGTGYLPANVPAGEGTYWAALDGAVVSGDAAVGEVLSVKVTGSLADAGNTYKYVWQNANSADGPWSDITGANAKTYTQTTADFNKYIRCVVTTESGSDILPEVNSNVVGPVEKGSVEAPVVSITGTPAVDEILSAEVSGLPTEGENNISYQWQREDENGNWVDITGAAGKDYTLTLDDFNKEIRVVVNVENPYYEVEQGVSDPAGPVEKGVASAPSVNVSGSATLNATLIASATGAPVAGHQGYNYQWQRADSVDGPWNNIAGATGTNYVMTLADFGKYLRVSVTTDNIYYNVETAYSEATGPVGKDTAAISGVFNPTTPAVGESLTLTLSNVPSEGENSLTYTWAYGDSKNGAIWTGFATHENLSATSDSVVVPFTAFGKYIQCTVEGENTYYVITTLNKVTDVAVAPGAFTGAVTLSTNSPVIGEAVTATPSAMPEGATASYQWYADGVAISGATGNTYTPVISDFGKKLTCVVTDGNGIYDGSISSAETNPVGQGTLTGNVTISGDTVAGSTLTAAVADLPAGAEAEYVWYSGDTAGELTTQVGDGNEYTVTEDDAETYLTVVVSDSSGYYAGTLTVSSEQIEPLIKAQALVLDNSANSAEDANPMVFINDTQVAVGETFVSDTYGELTVLAAYEVDETAAVDPAWMNGSYKSTISSVSFEDTIAPVSTQYWFSSWCMPNVKTIDLTGLDTSNLTTMYWMFSAAQKLEALDVSGMDVSKVSDFENVFNSCAAITELDLSTWDMSNATNMTGMFTGMDKLANITLGENWKWVSTQSSSLLPEQSFDGADGKWYDAEFTGYTPSELADAWSAEMAGTYTAIAPIPEAYAIYSADDTTLYFVKSVTEPVAGEDFTASDGSVISVTAVYSGFEETNYPMNEIYVEGYLYLSTTPWQSHLGSITSVEVKDEIKPVSMQGWFANAYNLTSMDLAKVDTSQCENMAYTFYSCNALPSLDLSGWDTSLVESMSNTFAGCWVLSDLDISTWNTENVTNMNSMFSGFASSCGIETLDVSALDTASVTDMGGMFMSVGAESISFGDNWNTENVTNMNSMFSHCESLAELDLSSFDTADVGGMYGMFYACKSLTSLDLSSFDMSSVTNAASMFSIMNNLSEITLGENWTWVGTNGYLPDQTFNIDGADGKWYNVDTLTGYEPASVPSGAGTYTAIAPKITGTVTVTGNYFIGETLTAEVTDLTDGVTPKIQWYAGDAAGERTTLLGTGNSLSLADNVKDKYITVVVTDTTGTYAGELVHEGEKVIDLEEHLATSSAYAAVYGENTLVFGRTADGKAPRTYNGLDLTTAYDSDNGYDIENIENGVYELYMESTVFPPDAFIPRVPWNDEYNGTSSAENITKVIFDDIIRPVSTEGWFMSGYIAAGFSNCTTFEGLDKLNTSKTTNMSEMFSGCSSVSELDLSGFDTASVTDMAFMFSGCNSLTSLNLAGWDTSNVSNMLGMFGGCGVTELDLSGFDTSNVTHMNSMFADCASLTELDLSSFDTSNVTGMGNMFRYSDNLSTIIFPQGFGGAATNMYGMFVDCTSLTNMNLTNFDTSNVTDMSHMFDGCSSLETIDLSSFNTANVTYMGSMFRDCPALTTIYASNLWSTASVTSSNYMFENCSAPLVGDITWTESNATDKTYAKIKDGYLTYKWMPGAYALVLDNSANSSTDTTPMVFVRLEDEVKVGDTFNSKNYGSVPVTVIYSGFENAEPSSSTEVAWYESRSDITSVSFEDVIKPKSMRTWFYGMTKCDTFDFTNLDSSEVTDMTAMFAYARSAASTANPNLDLSSLDTSNVESMWEMFYGNAKLESVDVSGWNTSNVENMSYMFSGCSSLTELDLTGFDVSSVDTMENMFYMVAAPTIGQGEDYALNLEGWDTSGVQNMRGMFWGVDATEISLPSFDTSSATNMTYMFHQNQNLANIDVTNFDTSNVLEMEGMFSYCYVLPELDLSSFDMSNVSATDGMFDYMNKLEKVTFGTNWTWVGTSGYLPDQTDNIDNADGKWYNKDGTGYLPSEVPNGAGTYTAIVLEGLKSISATWNGGTITTTDPIDLSQISATATYSDGTTKDLVEVAELPVSITPSATYPWTQDENGVWKSGNKGVVGTSSMTVSFTLDEAGTLSFDRSVSSYDYSYGYGYMYYTITKDGTTYAGGDTSTYRIYGNEGITNSANLPWETVKMNLEAGSYEVTFAYQKKFSSSFGLDAGFVKDINVINVSVADGFSISPDSFPEGTITDQIVTISYTEDGITKSAEVTVPVVLPESCYAAVYGGNTLVFGNGTAPATYINDSGTELTLTSGAAWTGIESLTPASTSDVPWLANYATAITAVDTVDIITPVSTAYWFQGMTNLASADLSKLNTSITTDMNSLFYNCSNLSSIKGMGSWDVSNVKNLGWLVYGCSSLTSLDDLSSWDTSACTNLKSMFYNCSNLSSIKGMGSWNVSEAQDMSYMLYGCSSLASIDDLSSWDTSACTDMRAIFYNCSNLSSIKGMGSWDVSNVKNLGWLVYGCSSLTSLDDLSSWDTSACTNLKSAFCGCTNLSSINVSGWDTSNVTDMSYAFKGCSSFVELDLSNWSTASASTTNYMFSGVSKLQKVTFGKDWEWVGSYGYLPDQTDNIDGASSYWYSTDGEEYYYSSVPDGAGTYSVFNPLAGEAFAIYDEGVKTLYFVRNETTPSGTFTASDGTEIACTNVYSGFELASRSWSGISSSVESVKFIDMIKPYSSTANWFKDMSNCKSMDLEKLCTLRVSDMSNMFYGCTSLTTIYVSDLWGADNVTSSNDMFYNCTTLKGGNGTTFDSSHIDVEYARVDATETPGYLTDKNYSGGSGSDDSADIETDDLLYAAVYGGNTMTIGLGSTIPSSYNGLTLTESWTGDFIFSNYNQLPWIDYLADITSVTVVDTIRPASLAFWFYFMESCETYDLAKLDTSGVTSMKLLFVHNYALTELDLSAWDTSNVTEMADMFVQSNKLKTIYVSELWNTDKVPADSDVVSQMDGLVGGNGTYFIVARVTDKSYMRIDAAGTPGYLTYKAAPAAVTGYSLARTVADAIEAAQEEVELAKTGEIAFADTDSMSELLCAQLAGQQSCPFRENEEMSLMPLAWTAGDEVAGGSEVMNGAGSGTGAGASGAGSASVSGGADGDEAGSFTAALLRTVALLSDSSAILTFADEEAVLNLTDIDGAVVTLYAMWEPIEYTVHYNGNGNDGGETPDSTHYYNTPSELSENGFTRGGWEFVEWNTEPDGSGTGYAGGEIVENLTKVDGDVVELYAIWQPLYKIYIYADGELVHTDLVNNDLTYTVTDEAIEAATREECEGMDGFYYGTEDGSDYTTKFVDGTTLTEDIHIHARNKVTLTFDATDRAKDLFADRVLYTDTSYSTRAVLYEPEDDADPMPKCILPENNPIETWYGTTIIVPEVQDAYYKHADGIRVVEASRTADDKPAVYLNKEGSGEPYSKITVYEPTTVYYGWKVAVYDGVIDVNNR